MRLCWQAVLGGMSLPIATEMPVEEALVACLLRACRIHVYTHRRMAITAEDVCLEKVIPITEGFAVQEGTYALMASWSPPKRLKGFGLYILLFSLLRLKIYSTFTFLPHFVIPGGAHVTKSGWRALLDYLLCSPEPSVLPALPVASCLTGGGVTLCPYKELVGLEMLPELAALKAAQSPSLYLAL